MLNSAQQSFVHGSGLLLITEQAAATDELAFYKAIMAKQEKLVILYCPSFGQILTELVTRFYHNAINSGSTHQQQQDIDEKDVADFYFGETASIH